MKKLASICLVYLFFSTPTSAQDPPHDGHLRLYHSHLDESLDITYKKSGQWDAKAVRDIQHFMRSRDSGQEYAMDVRLIELLDHIQDHFGADTVEIISGYRSPAFNAALKEEGRNVATNSNHLRGIAADIHLDEVTENNVQKYVRTLKKGGVGYYPKILMVHVDLGPIKFWQDGNFEERTDIGVFNNEFKMALHTDKLFYFPGQRQELHNLRGENLHDGEDVSEKNRMELEWFFRGHWLKILTLDDAIYDIQLKPTSKQEADLVQKTSDGKSISIPYGKFRWKIHSQTGRQWQHSNEFYLKRR